MTITGFSRRNACRSGHAVNPNVAMVTGFSVHADEGGIAPPRRGRLAVFPLRPCASLYLWRAQAGTHRYLGQFREGGGMRCRRPAPITASARRISCEPICGTSRSRASTRPCSSSRAAATSTGISAKRLELFAEEVMPEFQGSAKSRGKGEKQEELAPYIEKAMARKQMTKTDARRGIPVYVALGRKVAEEGTGTERAEAERQAVGRCRQGDAERSRRATAPRPPQRRSILSPSTEQTTCSINQPPSPPHPHVRPARRLSHRRSLPASGPGPFACMMLWRTWARRWSRSIASAPRRT